MINSFYISISFNKFYSLSTSFCFTILTFIEEGSTNIKLKADYLSTLSAGKHTISINSTSGSATTAFTIEETAKTSSGATTAVSPDAKSPKTGDNNLFLWTTMLCISGFAIFGTRIYSKKEKNIK